MKAKERHRLNLLEYLSNPSNNFLNRQEMAETVLKIKSRTMRNHFTSVELDAIESEALEIRRKRCASISARVDRGLIKRAESGDPAACKLYYQKFEGWKEAKRQETTGEDGGPIQLESGLSAVAERKLMELTKLD